MDTHKSDEHPEKCSEGWLHTWCVIPSRTWWKGWNCRQGGQSRVQTEQSTRAHERQPERAFCDENILSFDQLGVVSWGRDGGHGTIYHSLWDVVIRRLWAKRPRISLHAFLKLNMNLQWSQKVSQSKVKLTLFIAGKSSIFVSNNGTSKIDLRITRFSRN